MGGPGMPVAAALVDLVRQTGTKHSKQFEAAMQWAPDTILAFPNGHGEFHERRPR